MKKLAIMALLLLSGALLRAQDTTQQVIPGRENASQEVNKPYVILISADGFRYDLAKKYKAKHLQKLAKRGVRAEYMKPPFPSLTFPNHYTIATGMYPAHHGLVDNTMYDPAKKATYNIGNRKEVKDSSWYGGKPIWVLAEQQKMLTACFYWVGSESAEEGVRPTYYYNYNEKIGIDRRIQVVKDWLTLPEAKRPHLITFYLPEVDHEEHSHGLESPEAEKAVQFVDSAIDKMVNELEPLGLDINYIFLSDHGMTDVDTAHTLEVPQIDTTNIKVAGGSTMIHLYFKDKKDIPYVYSEINKQASGYKAYLSTDLPANWHYSQKDDEYGRIGDLVLVADVHRVFRWGRRPPPRGQHGYDPELEEMYATFYAWGPAFRKKKIDGFENVHVYPLIARILGLTYTHKIDGNPEVLGPVLR